jgi:hypothetical protein
MTATAPPEKKRKHVRREFIHQGRSWHKFKQVLDAQKNYLLANLQKRQGAMEIVARMGPACRTHQSDLSTAAQLHACVPVLAGRHMHPRYALRRVKQRKKVWTSGEKCSSMNLKTYLNGLDKQCWAWTCCIVCSHTRARMVYRAIQFERLRSSSPPRARHLWTC